ncbi:MAG: hypothetical protein PF485_11990 [Bacteroidales bacterium]|jgi:hypothetical protein|nr:hypothetical protein [Bacteroidales bacterium]
MKNLKFLLVLLLIINFSCRDKEIDNPIKDWFQDPPVSPVTQTIKTVVPVGYAASLVVMDMKGYKSTNTKSVQEKSSKILYVDTNIDYPYKFKGDTYGEMIIAYVQTDTNTALVSVFFTDMDIISGNFELQNVIAFPVVIDNINKKITAVYASMDINLGADLFDIDLTQEETTESLGKLNNQAITDNSDVEIAVTQDAWIIEIFHNDTYDNLLDDNFKISGGQQAIAVEDFETESSAGVLQMAMINVDFSSECIENPTSGYVFMQDIEVESSTNNTEIVFGHVFYEFTPSCDGQILVDIATGNFIFAIGSRLDLDLI